MNNFSFALSHSSLVNGNVKTWSREVKTLKWCKLHKKSLTRWADRLTSANRDNRQVIGGMLQTAYGANIGKQIEDTLTDEQLVKIRSNIIKAVY